MRSVVLVVLLAQYPGFVRRFKQSGPLHDLLSRDPVPLPYRPSQRGDYPKRREPVTPVVLGHRRDERDDSVIIVPHEREDQGVDVPHGLTELSVPAHVSVTSLAEPSPESSQEANRAS